MQEREAFSTLHLQSPTRISSRVNLHQIGRGAAKKKRIKDSSLLTTWGMACFDSRLLLSIVITLTLIVASNSSTIVLGTEREEVLEPSPTKWPDQFHAVLVMNNTKTSELQVIDLWYDWLNGRNLNLIQHQLGKLVHDVEWNNGTSFYYNLGVGGGWECKTVHFEVGILRPNWLEEATYIGQSYVDGFLCNVWEKADFIRYYEDVLTKRPVHWLFYTGRAASVMTFEVGAVLEDSKWQAPIHCFHKQAELHDVSSAHARLLGSLITTFV